jgi:hypothetical protein
MMESTSSVGFWFKFNFFKTEVSSAPWKDRMVPLYWSVARISFKSPCNGGGPKDRFAISRDGDPGQNYLYGATK